MQISVTPKIEIKPETRSNRITPLGTATGKLIRPIITNLELATNGLTIFKLLEYVQYLDSVELPENLAVILLECVERSTIRMMNEKVALNARERIEDLIAGCAFELADPCLLVPTLRCAVSHGKSAVLVPEPGLSTWADCPYS